MTGHDLVVIGAGPGGYVAAIRAAQLGLDTACVEKEPRLGGTCLRIGCIPSKALLESSELLHAARHSFAAHGIRAERVDFDLAAMQARKSAIVDQFTRGVASLFKKHKITRYEGHGRLAGPGKVQVDTAKGSLELSARHVVLASGSKSAPLPGVALDGERIGTSTEALQYERVPERLVVIGAGAIGLELGSVWSRLGAQVTVVEYLPRILPGMDMEIAQETRKLLEKRGLTFRLGARVVAARATKSNAKVELEGAPALECDKVLLAVGRVPNTEGLGLESVGIELDSRGRIPVDAHFRTKAGGVFAIGDVIAGPMLAHKAEEEAVACVERIVTGAGHVNYDAIPSVVYTAPEVAAVGFTEEQLISAGRAFRKGSFPFQVNGRAKALGETEGRVKLLADAETDRVLGVHIVGPRAGDLIAEAAAAIEFCASAEDLARTCHAHPTLPEALKEAALAALGRALHI